MADGKDLKGGKIEEAGTVKVPQPGKGPVTPVNRPKN